MFMRLSKTGLFKAHWTERIHEEWISSVLRKRPDIDESKLLAVKLLMDKYIEDALVTNYESIEKNLHLPDPKDTHVLAAAIKSKADAIVTFNIKDFPESTLKMYDIEVLHPDEFIAYQIGLSPPKVFLELKKMRSSLKNPPFTPNEFLISLEKKQLPITANLLSDYLDHI
jgi:predicted nucleic acid-binding protein